MKLTSYINAVKHRDIDTTVEKLIEKALSAWDLCLAQYKNELLMGGGRTEPRILNPEERM